MSAESAGWPDGLMRVLSITWPKNQPMHPAEIKLHQHDTGIPLWAVTKMVLTADVVNAPIVAALTMLVDENGLPIDLDGCGPVVLDDAGDPRMGVFQWVVAEMRIAE